MTRLLGAKTTGELTLGELLDQDELGLEPIVAPEGWEARAITGAHSIEIDHPAAWLDRDWVMLTTGVHLSRKRDDQRQLISELDDAHIAALGFGLDVVHRRMPPAILEEAKKRGFPIFTIPLRTAFREVISAVYRATLGTEIRSSYRLAAMQRFLMDSLGEESPRSTVLQRLASLIEASVAIVDEAGDVLLSTRQIPGAQIAAAVRGLSVPSTDFEVEGMHGLAFALKEPTATEARWLVAGKPAGRPLHPLTRPAAQATLPLLTAMARLDERRQVQEVAIRQATLETLLDVDDPKDAVVVAARAAATGIDLGQGVHAIVAMDPTGESDIAGLMPLAASDFSAPRQPSLATIREGRLMIVATGPVPDDVIIERLGQAGPKLSFGIGRRATDVSGAKQSFADAELAVRAAVSSKSERIVRYDDLDFETVLLNEVPLDRLRPKMDAWLAPLAENPLALEALQAYLRYDLDVGRTARSLSLHPNSVRYRLSRAEELIGARLKSPATIVALHVALFSGDIDSARLDVDTSSNRGET